jgi:glucose uptake protein GlcU
VTTPHTGSNAVGGRSINQTVAMVFGAIYVLVGVLGFFVSDTFAGTEDSNLLGLFQVNHLHNIVHLLIGVALVAASRRHDAARGANLAIGVTYLALGVLGWFIQDTALNIVALNEADHLLHLASGAVLTAVALGADKHARTRA